MGTLSGEATLSVSLCPPGSKGSTLKGKDLLPRSKPFPLKVDPVLEELSHPGKKAAIRKSQMLFPFIRKAEIHSRPLDVFGMSRLFYVRNDI